MTKQSNRAAVLAVAAVLVVVVAVLVLVQVLGDDEQPVTASGDDASSAPVEVPPGECIDPPPLPEAPMTFDEVPDASLAEDSTWTATVSTNCGNIVMELDGAAAPQTVASFIFLAREGYWDDSACHRLTTQEDGIFVLQCGDPTGTGGGNPGYGYGVENPPEDFGYPRGTLAMARTTDPNTNGGQFFIVYEQTELNDPNGYTIFGTVTEGMDIVDRIVESGKGGEIAPTAPKQPISILGVTVEKG